MTLAIVMISVWAGLVLTPLTMIVIRSHKLRKRYANRTNSHHRRLHTV